MIRFFSCLLLGGAIAAAQTPSIAPGGVLNAASFAKDSNGFGTPVAPGALVAIFGSFSGASLANADTIPLSNNLGNVQITFNNVPARIQAVSPAGAFPFVTAQVPFEVLPAGQTTVTANVVVAVNGVISAPEQTTIVTAAPGIFTIPPDGQSNGILVFVDPASGTAKIAAPASASASIGYPTAPIPRGTSAFFYANGLGAMTPPVADGDGPLTGPTHSANAKPVVLIGGITAEVDFAGQAPGFPGVSQINIVVPQNAPTGNSVPLQIMSADGSITTSAKVTVAIQ